MDKINEVLTRGVEKIYPSKKALEKVLRSDKKIKIYQGFDPSMPSLHLGNFVGLMKLRAFQKLGHQVIFLVGDFTGMIGDPTDKSATRQMLTRQQTLKNSQKWQQQANRVLDFNGDNPAKFKFNSQWLDKVSFKDLIEFASHFTYQQLIERDMYQARIKKNKPIFVHELLYPIAQAIDGLMMNIDLEIGGNDQTFNMLAGRTLMKVIKNKEKFVLTTKLLVDRKGNKIGKTTGNALFLDSPPKNFYGGIMAFPDEAIAPAFELLTEVPLKEIDEKIKKDPMGQKKRLAFEIVKLLWGEKDAQRAQEHFENVFQSKKLPAKMPSFTTSQKSWQIVNLLVKTGLAESNSAAKRLIRQKAIDLNNQNINNPQQKIKLKQNDIIRCGKTKFLKIKIK